MPYKMSDMKWADAYFDTVLTPFENQGIDFWWLDWQQWVTSKYVKDLNSARSWRQRRLLPSSRADTAAKQDLFARLPDFCPAGVIFCGEMKKKTFLSCHSEGPWKV